MDILVGSCRAQAFMMKYECRVAANMTIAILYAANQE